MWLEARRRITSTRLTWGSYAVSRDESIGGSYVSSIRTVSNLLATCSDKRQGAKGNKEHKSDRQRQNCKLPTQAGQAIACRYSIGPRAPLSLERSGILERRSAKRKHARCRSVHWARLKKIIEIGLIVEIKSLYQVHLMVQAFDLRKRALIPSVNGHGRRFTLTSSPYRCIALPLIHRHPYRPSGS